MPEARATTEKQERRRQRGSTTVHGQKLGVNPAFLDQKNFSHRWINDDKGRIEQLTQQDDYELVADPTKAGKPDADGLGAMISKVVGVDDGGRPIRAYLAKKPLPFYRDDQREKAASIKKTMDAIKRGTSNPDGATPLGDNGYVSGISIKDET